MYFASRRRGSVFARTSAVFCAIIPGKKRNALVSGQLGALLSSPVLDVRLMTALQVLQGPSSWSTYQVVFFLSVLSGTEVQLPWVVDYFVFEREVWMTEEVYWSRRGGGGGGDGGGGGSGF